MSDQSPTLFLDEESLLRRAKEMGTAAPAEVMAQEYQTLLEGYGRLLRQTKKLVRISDNLQRQLSQRSQEVRQEREKSERMLELLITIGRSLSRERDHDQLLHQILLLSEKLTGADSASIYTVDPAHPDHHALVFRQSHSCSDKRQAEQRPAWHTGSVPGQVAATGKTLNIADVRSAMPVMDAANDYPVISMLAIPMRNHANDVIGVIQLVNCKEGAAGAARGDAWTEVLNTPEDFARLVVPFPERYESLMEAVAGQAAIAVENNRMILRIQSQFEEFVRAAVAAIESRDPASAGHASRVARMAVNTARALNAAAADGETPYTEIQIKQLEMAGLLHDFGKLYVETAVLQKGKKLYPRDFELMMLRLEYIHRSLELDQARSPATLQQISELLGVLKQIRRTVVEMNEPTLLDEDPRALLQGVQSHERELHCRDLDGRPVPLLTEPEIASLGIRRGTLTPDERAAVESHVEHSYTFVRKIPWPAEFQEIPDIIRKHHEKLDGSGYPLRLRGEQEIPLGARIMAIADIFDALSAADRPYKKAVPLPKVFEVLRQEGARRQLDPELVELFIRTRAFETA